LLSEIRTRAAVHVFFFVWQRGRGKYTSPTRIVGHREFYPLDFVWKCGIGRLFTIYVARINRRITDPVPLTRIRRGGCASSQVASSRPRNELERNSVAHQHMPGGQWPDTCTHVRPRTLPSSGEKVPSVVTPFLSWPHGQWRLPSELAICNEGSLNFWKLTQVSWEATPISRSGSCALTLGAALRSLVCYLFPLYYYFWMPKCGGIALTMNILRLGTLHSRGHD
jgi:hypothetical protein